MVFSKLPRKFQKLLIFNTDEDIKLPMNWTYNIMKNLIYLLSGKKIENFFSPLPYSASHYTMHPVYSAFARSFYNCTRIRFSKQSFVYHIRHSQTEEKEKNVFCIKLQKSQPHSVVRTLRFCTLKTIKTDKLLSVQKPALKSFK